MTEHANTKLKKDEVYMLWVASQTSLPAAKAKFIMLLPTCGIKACAKYQFLEENNEQCRRNLYRNLELLAFMSYMLQETAPSFQLEQLIKGMIG